jgi:GNAT superfamily N-acetyltransferase
VSAPYSFEPLGGHDRSSFSCGNDDLDRYFRLQAGQDARRKIAAPFVMVDRDGIVVGYYTLSAYAIRAGELEPALARKLPKYPLIPATLLGRLAVSSNRRGQGLGTRLLMDALFRSWRSTAEIASAGVVAEAVDDAAVRFYRRHEFIPIAGHGRKLFLAMVTIAKAFR